MVVGGNGELRTLRIAAELGDACNLTTSDPAVLRHKVSVLRAALRGGRPRPRRGRRHACSTCRSSAATGMTSGRGWSGCGAALPQPAFAARTHAGTVAEHRDRHAALAELGVSTVFLSTPDLDGPEAVLDAGRAQRVSGGELVALAVCLAVMVGANVWVHVGPARWQPVTGPLAAALLLLVGRAAGLSWAQLGLGRGRSCRDCSGAGRRGLRGAGRTRSASRVPATRAAVPRQPAPGRDEVDAATAPLAVPLGTVVFEEVAFRGVLWGLLEHDHGAGLGDRRRRPCSSASGTCCPPSPAARDERAAGAGGPQSTSCARWLGTVAVHGAWPVSCSACCASQSGSLVAPALLHWATNGLGVVAAALAWRWSATPE